MIDGYCFSLFYLTQKTIQQLQEKILLLEGEDASSSKQEVTALKSELAAVNESLKIYQKRHTETIKELEQRELEIERFNPHYCSQDINLFTFSRYTRFLFFMCILSCQTTYYQADKQRGRSD